MEHVVDAVGAVASWVGDVVVDAITGSEMGTRRVFGARATLEGKGHGYLQLVKPSDASPSAPFTSVGVIEFVHPLGAPLVVRPGSIANATLAGSRLSLVCGTKLAFVFDKPGAALQAAAALAAEAGVAVSGVEAAALAHGEADIFADVARCNIERLERELADGAYVRRGVRWVAVLVSAARRMARGRPAAADDDDLGSAPACAAHGRSPPVPAASPPPRRSPPAATPRPQASTSTTGRP